MTDELAETLAEIVETEKVLANLRGVTAWNDGMREKLVWQIDACERHLARLLELAA